MYFSTMWRSTQKSSVCGAWHHLIVSKIMTCCWKMFSERNDFQQITLAVIQFSSILIQLYLLPCLNQDGLFFFQEGLADTLPYGNNDSVQRKRLGSAAQLVSTSMTRCSSDVTWFLLTLSGIHEMVPWLPAPKRLTELHFCYQCYLLDYLIVSCNWKSNFQAFFRKDHCHKNHSFPEQWNLCCSQEWPWLLSFPEKALIFTCIYLADMVIVLFAKRMYDVELKNSLLWVAMNIFSIYRKHMFLIHYRKFFRLNLQKGSFKDFL